MCHQVPPLGRPLGERLGLQARMDGDETRCARPPSACSSWYFGDEAGDGSRAPRRTPRDGGGGEADLAVHRERGEPLARLLRAPASSCPTSRTTGRERDQPSGGQPVRRPRGMAGRSRARRRDHVRQCGGLQDPSVMLPFRRSATNPRQPVLLEGPEVVVHLLPGKADPEPPRSWPRPARPARRGASSGSGRGTPRPPRGPRSPISITVPPHRQSFCQARLGRTAGGDAGRPAPRDGGGDPAGEACRAYAPLCRPERAPT
jgi:hypothetical protein